MAGTNIAELYSGQKWSGTTITYSFIGDFPDYYTTDEKSKIGNVGALSTAQQQVIVGILNYIQTVTGLTFVPVDPATGQTGDITFATSSKVPLGWSAFTRVPITTPGVGGDVWFKPDLVSSVFEITALHEIGHALGLKHPNANSGDLFPQGPFLSSDENFISYTVMTNREANSNYRNVPDPSTFMLYDIAELQFLYGASNANSGNDTYPFGGTPVRMTIWDTGGTDTISAAGASRGAVINLNETKFSSIINDPSFSLSNPARNIAIAQGVTIEKAIGTAQADIIVGNKVKNNLDGGAGNDLIFGDELVAKKILVDGDNYRDVFIDDLFWFKGAYQIDGSTDANDEDTISGGAGLDWIYGGAGNDILGGGAGNDYLDGGAGTDTALYDDATSAQTLELHKGTAPDGVRTDGTVPVAEEKFLAISRGSETDTLRSIEKIKLSDQADTLKIRAGTDLKALTEIDAASNPSGTPDVVDLSQYDGKLQLRNGHLTGDGIDIKLDNFEKLVGTAGGDTFDLNDSTITWADGGAGNDILTGGASQSILTGGDGTDQLFAGRGGATLDGGVSKGQGDSYVGGAGADTFVIGNGTHVRQGTDAKFNISNAGTNDRLVLRLANTVGLADESALTQGIVLSGGIQPLIWYNDGILFQTPHVADPNHVYAVFSSVLVQPTGVTAQSDNGRSSAGVDGRLLEDARPLVGKFTVFYDWNKSASTLDINITTAYGDFAVHIDNYKEGQLGLNFIDKNEPIDGLTMFGDNAAALLQGSWSGYNDTMRSLVQAAQIVDIPSPGKAEDGDADPVTPTVPLKGYLPKFNSHFDPGEGAAFGGSGNTGNPNDPNNPDNGNNPKRAPFLDKHSNPLKSDPLILDLSGNGLHLTAESLSDTYVDFNGTGFATRTGWVDADEGILINYTGSTAIGPNTILGAASGDGFADLAALDSNSDGQVDASDSAAASLRVWVDQNGDGQIGTDEVFTLADAGVSSIGLQTAASGQFMNDNTVIATGSFVRTDASTGDVFEVKFETDPIFTRKIIPDGFEYSAEALDLPTLDGYGRVADLQYGMTVDADLESQALQLVLNSGAMTGSQFDAAFEHLVQSWAGAAAIDPASRGPLIDARHMAVVEAFYGQTFAEVNQPGTVLDATDAANIEQAYRSIVDAMKIRFVAQIKDAAIANGQTPTDAANNPLAAFATLDYTAATDVVSLNLAQLATSIANAIPSDPAKREAYVDLVARAARAMRVDFYAEDSIKLAAGLDAAVATAGLALGWRLQLAAEIKASSIVDATGQASTVSGTSSNEVILAGVGDQTLAGGGGADVYVYSAADGNDIIHAGGSQSGLILTDIARSDVTFSRSGENVLVAIASTGKTITIAGQLNGQGAGTLQTVTFADGTSLSSWDIAGLVNPANEFDGTSGADNLVSPGYSNETYDLGTGDDHLFDRNVNGNTFVYRSGDGNDSYDVSSQQTPTSVLNLLGLNAADITATRLHGDLLVKVNATNEVVTIAGQFTDAHNGIATIQFANGTSWDRTAINAVPDTTPAAVYSISGHPSVNDGATLEFTVNRTPDNTTGTVTVSYSLGGTAVAGTDYTVPAGSVTFAPGQLSRVIDIQTIGQANPAPDKSVVVTLASLIGGPGTISSTAASSDGTIIESGASLAITSEVLANDTGRSQSDLITQDGHVSLTGTTPTGASVLIFDGGLSLGSAAISGSNWTFSTNLSEGTHALHAVAIDGSGVIATTPAAATIVVDNTAPDNPRVTTLLGAISNSDEHLVMLGTSEPGSVVRDSYTDAFNSTSGVWDIPTDPSGNWTFDVTAFGQNLAPGLMTYSFITATDAAGNETPSLKGRFGLAPVHGYSLSGVNTGQNYFTVVAGGSITFGNSSGGGNGKNTVVFTPAAGYSTDIIPNGGVGNVLLAPEKASSDIYFQANSFGDLFVRFRGSDSYIDAHNALQTASWGVTSAITSIGNGSWKVALGQPAAGLGAPLTFTWLGTGNNYFLTGSNYGSNIYEITAGSGIINFGNSTQGGDGTNTVKYARGDATADINVNGGTGVIAFASGIAAQDVYWQSNNFGDLTLRIRGDATDSIVVHGDLVNQAGTVTSAVHQLQFADGSSTDLAQPLTFTWLGTGNNYFLTGSNYGSNVFEITAGSGTINFGNSSKGGDGTNTVKYIRGDANADINLNGGTGVIAFAAGIAAQDVYWQSNNFGDLTLRIRDDATDSIVVHGDLVNQAGTVTSAVHQLQFANGSAVDLAQPLTFTWLGTGNNYFLTGSNYGSNVFEITAGSGTINFGNSSKGGDGTNTVKYLRGDANADVNLNGGTGTIAFGAGIAQQDVYWQSNSFGDLTLRIRGDATDSIVVHGDLVNQAGTVTSAVHQLQFGDGSSTDLAQPLTFTWLGTGNNYFLTGSNYGSNVFDITAGSGIINFGNSSQGGDGKNTIKYIRGDAVADVNLNSGTGTIAFGAGISAQDVYWQSNGFGDLTVKIRDDATDSIVVHGDLVNTAGTVTSAIRQLQFSEGSSIDLTQPLTFTWLGSSNNYFLTGSNYGSNVFEITVGSGNVTFGNSSSGGSGTNVIKYNQGTGRLDVGLNGGTGTLQMGSGLTAANVSFQSNSSGDLIVNINGDATDTVIIHNDYATVNGTLTSGISQIQFGDGSSISALSLDFVAPGVSSVTASGIGITSGDGAVGLGGVVTLTVNFSENVLVNTTGGTPTLSLNDGGVATYTGGTGTSALTFSYTVGAGQSTSDLTVTSLNLNGSTIADAAANAAVLSGATTNPAGTLLVDSSAPTVSSVTTSPASGTVITGAVVTLTVNFSENVTVNTSGGTPTLTLSDGGSATYTGGSGTSALTFSHTVAAGQSTADLTVTALNLNGGTINDVASNAAVLTGAVTNPAGILVVDGIAPTVSSIAASGTGITAGSGVLNAGKVVTLTANFSENVTVNTTGGTPTLTLNDGGTATYAGGSGTGALTFTYTVAAGQNTPDLAVTALNFNGATIKDAAGNTALVTGAATNPSGTLQIDTTASTVSSVTTSGTGISSGSGTVGVGTIVTLTANFSENVVVTTTGGTPTLTLNDGGTATYTGGSGTSALTFNYTVAAGQNTSDLTVTALNLNGGTIKDVAGNTAVVTGAASNPAGILVVDTTAPTVSSVTTSPGSGNVILGQVVTLTVNFSESVIVNTSGGTPSLALNDGGVATYTGGSGTGALTFSYTVAAGQSTSDLTVTALNLNGGTIKDAGGNAAVVTGAVTNPAGILLVDGNAPTATSIAATGTGITSGSGILNAGKVVTLKATLNEAATVTTTGGTPSLALNDGGVATYTSGSGTTALTFTYTVAAGQNTPDLTVTGLNLNGGTVKDAAGNTAVITGNPAGTLQIDTTSPGVNSVATSGTGITAGNGVLNAGKVVTLTANFSENVTVVTTGGKPTLTLNDGGSATYASGSGTAALAFTYTVAAGQNTADLAVTALNLNGGTIKDAAGNAAVVTGAATNPAGTLQIDTTASTVSSVVASGTGITAGTGSLNAGKVVTLTVNFNESVVVAGGTPTLTLNDGGTATYTGGSGTSALAFNYTVAAGQNTADLTVTAFNLGTSTIKDVAGNTAVVTGAVTNPAGTLKIDTTAATVSSVVTSGPGITSGNGTLGVGAVVTLTVNCSEAAVVNTAGGTPTLTLNDGGVATYSAGSGTSALAFTYTVAAGQNTPDLTVTAANLNGGSITDTAGNAAVLTGAVTNPAGTLQISTPAGPMAPPSSQTFASANESTPTIYTLSSTESATITPDYSSGASNEFDFTGNVTDENLWFLQSGNDLQIDIMGTKNQATIAGWFNGGNQASEVFTAGGLRLDSQVSQLVQAMAAYSDSNAGFDPTASTVHQIPNDPALQNTVAAAWHA